MAERNEILNCAILFGGSDLNNIWNTMVVVVFKMKLICEISKVT
jgi:hypothetical protein